MKPIILVTLLAACGGGASITTEPGATITSARCDMFTSNTLRLEMEYQVTLEVGQAFEATVQFAGNTDTVTEVYFCGFWASVGSGSTERGCVRESPDDEPTEDIMHSYSLDSSEPLQPPIELAVFANVVAAPFSDVTIGDSDFATVPCI
ncbi:MAG: hypothetical protein H0V17_34240 [Deltaproteobacteria bacterium]|nr:hypothetical protein [Deltaproteobacteria bacterium]